MSLRDYLESKGFFAKYGDYCPVTGAASPALEFELVESRRLADERAGYGPQPPRPPAPDPDILPPW